MPNCFSSEPFHELPDHIACQWAWDVVCLQTDGSPAAERQLPDAAVTSADRAVLQGRAPAGRPSAGRRTSLCSALEWSNHPTQSTKRLPYDWPRAYEKQHTEEPCQHNSNMLSGHPVGCTLHLDCPSVSLSVLTTQKQTRTKVIR